MHFMLRLMTLLTVQSRVTPEGTLECTPNDALRNVHKDVQEGAFEVALKGALEVALGLHLWFHLLMQSLTYKSVENASFNGGPDSVLGAALDGGLNVALEGPP